jgi:hypothetical protein
MQNERISASAAFLKLSPMGRVEEMHRLLCEVIAIKAEAEGVPEDEIYRRYLRDNPRHYERPPRKA